MNFSNVLRLKRNAHMGQKAPGQKTLKRKTPGRRPILLVAIKGTAMTTTTIIMCAVCMTIPLCGILAAIVPYLQRRTEVFAVTVPSVAQDDAYVKGLKRKYAAIMLTVTVALTLACAMAAYAQRPLVLFVLLIGGTFALMFVSYGLMLFYRRRMVSYKKERGWVAQSQQSVASLGAELKAFRGGCR